MPINIDSSKLKDFTVRMLSRNNVEVAGGRYVLGLARLPDITMSGISEFDVIRSITKAYLFGNKEPFKIVFPDKSVYSFGGIVTSIKEQMLIDGQSSVDVTVKPTGIVSFKRGEQRMPKGLKRFYVGSNRTTADWTHTKLADAVAHAKKLVESGSQDEAFVVQIVRVVRKKATPIVVENFRG